MSKRIKKPTVKLEQRVQWLRRYEAGESAARIADSDEFDVRTVRRHIEEARQEREVREARVMVLRSALENHYADLCRLAEKLDAEIAREEPIYSLLGDDRMLSALKQHLPRSPLWPSADKWNNVLQELVELQDLVKTRLKQVLESDSRISPISSAGEEGVIDGLVATLAFQLKSWPREYRGLDLKADFHMEPAEEGFVNLRYGFAHMGKVNKERAAIIQEIVRDYESEVVNWEEYNKLQKLFRELDRLKRYLRDELASIMLRRIVSGKCKYCPL